MQFQLEIRPYICNLFQKGPDMIGIIGNLPSLDSSRNHSHVILGHFRHCNRIWSQLVRIAIIYGPIRSVDCIHIRSSSLLYYIAYIFSSNNN